MHNKYSTLELRTDQSMFNTRLHKATELTITEQYYIAIPNTKEMTPNRTLPSPRE